MRIIRNKFIPFKGFKCVNVFGVLFVRKDSVLTDADINHEAIHTAQMKEMLYVAFYVWYVIEWIARLVSNGFNTHAAYRAVSLEKESYANEDNPAYLQYRSRYSWIKYMTV